MPLFSNTHFDAIDLIIYRCTLRLPEGKAGVNEFRIKERARIEQRQRSVLSFMIWKENRRKRGWFAELFDTKDFS